MIDGVRSLIELSDVFFLAPKVCGEDEPDDPDVRRAVALVSRDHEWKNRRGAVANRLYTATLNRIGETDRDRFSRNATPSLGTRSSPRPSSSRLGIIHVDRLSALLDRSRLDLMQQRKRIWRTFPKDPVLPVRYPV
jgi:hypothetical protein